MLINSWVSIWYIYVVYNVRISFLTSFNTRYILTLQFRVLISTEQLFKIDFRIQLFFIL